MVWGNERLARGQVAQSHNSEEASDLPRRGSIYERLDRARERRVKTLAPESAANDAPQPARSKPRAPSKGHLLPPIKDQEVFDPPSKAGLSPAAKLAIGAIAFAIMAGFTLLDWRSGGPLTEVSAPNAPVQEAEDTQLPEADAPTRLADAPKVDGAKIDVLPAIPTAPSESPVIEVQQDTAPLAAPTDGGASNP